MTWFTSDNAGPAAPDIMAALTRANDGYTKGYGAEQIMDRVRTRIRDAFEAPDAEIFLVATGTAANALSLATLVQPWQAIYASEAAHVEWDECGAPEFFTGGAKIVLIPASDGKITPVELSAKLAEGTQTDVHQVQRGALSITNLTEFGTLYQPGEIADLAAIARGFGLPTHLDGARFANALVATGATPAEMTWRAGVDAVSFGGTKNGCLGVEAVILFDPAKAWEFQLRRKRAGHLFSKHRMLSAQMDAYLEDDLWLRLARQANAMASKLAAGLSQAQIPLTQKVEGNMLFPRLPRSEHQRLNAAGAHYYLWPHTASLQGPGHEDLICRLVTNWSTTQDDVDAFLALLRG